MPEFTSYPAGMPSWVDLGTHDVAASSAFYGSLLGWQTQDLGPEAGGYSFFTKNGKQVAGVGPLMAEGQPPAWTTYIATDDADATVGAVKAAGGTVLMGPMDVLEAGRMAVFADTTGAALGIWQAKQHRGAALANEPGSLCWNELQTRDTEAAKAFYGDVFGWGESTNDMGGMTYTEWKLGDRTIGGMMEMPTDVPAEVPAYWLAYFAVEDCDAVHATAGDLGAATLVAPSDIPPGRFSVLMDPQGATFAVIALSQTI